MNQLKNVGKNFQELILKKQQEKCRKKLKQIFEIIDIEENQVAFNNVDESFNRLIEITEALFSDPDITTLFHLYIRRIFYGIAMERRYYRKLDYGKEKEELADNIGNCYYWFKLYSRIVLDDPKKIRYEYILQNMSEIRNRLEHGPLTPFKKEDVTILGLLVLMWYFLEDVFERWCQILTLSETELEKKLKKLECKETYNDKDTKLYGFINKLEDKKGYITSYIRGERGKGTIFFADQIDFFPREGDIVEFRDHQETNREGKEYPTRKADCVRKV